MELSFDEILNKKEQELREITKSRIYQLENQVKQLVQQLEDQKGLNKNLKEDFEYNLSLLEERDSELQKFEQLNHNLQLQVQDKQRDISGYTQSLRDLETLYDQERCKSDQLELYYQQKFTEWKANYEHDIQQKEDEIKRTISSYETIKRTLQLQLHEKEEELLLQRDELSRNFSAALQQQQNDSKREVESLNEELHQLRIKCKEQTQIIDSLQLAKANEENAIASLREVEKKWKHSQWELEDVKRTLNGKLHILQDDNIKFEQVNQEILSEYENKMSEVLTILHNTELKLHNQTQEYEYKLEELQTASNEQASKIQNTMQQKVDQMERQTSHLQEELESMKLENKNLKWEMEQRDQSYLDQKEQWEEKITLLEHDYQTEIANMQDSLHTKESEIADYQHKLDAFKQTLAERRKDVQSFKQDLLEATDRESDLCKQLAQQKTEFETQLSLLMKDSVDPLLREHEHVVQQLINQRNDVSARLKDIEGLYSQASQRLTRLEKENFDLRAENRANQDKLSELTRKYTEVQLAHSALQRRHEDLQFQHSQVQEKYNQSQTQLARAETDRFAKYTQQLSSLAAENSGLKQQVQDLESKNTSMREVIADMKNAMEKVKTDFQIKLAVQQPPAPSPKPKKEDPLDVVVQQLKQQSEDTKIQNSKLKTELEDKQEQILHLKRNTLTLETSVNNLQMELQQKQHKVDAILSEMNVLRRQAKLYGTPTTDPNITTTIHPYATGSTTSLLMSLRKENHDIRIELELCLEDLKQTQAECEKLRSINQNLRDELFQKDPQRSAASEAELNQHQARVGQLGAKIQTLETENQILKKEILKLRDQIPTHDGSLTLKDLQQPAASTTKPKKVVSTPGNKTAVVAMDSRKLELLQQRKVLTQKLQKKA